MASFNRVLLLGNLTRDPETRTMPSGNAVCRFGLAVNRTYSTGEGERREETTFVDIEAFGRQAETIAKYMTKGRPILIEGRLRLDQWEDKNTKEKRSKMIVVAENFQFVGGRGDGPEGGGSSGGGYEENSPPPRARPAPASTPRATPPPPPPTAPAGGNSIQEDDVPF